MTDHEHTINRADSTRTDSDDDEADDREEEDLTDAERRRLLRQSEIGRAILQQNQRLQRRRGGP